MTLPEPPPPPLSPDSPETTGPSSPTLVMPPPAAEPTPLPPVETPAAVALVDRDVPAAIPFPKHLAEYDRFREASWVDPSGRCSPVPWRDERSSFGERLQEAMGKELKARQLPLLWIYATAAEQLKLSPLVASRDVQALADIMTAPQSSATGLDDQRGEELRHSGSELSIEPTPAWRVRIFLESVRPSPTSLPLLQDEQLADLVELAGFESVALKDLVLGLLKLGRRGLNPIARLRAARDASIAESPADLNRKLTEERNSFHEEIIRLWNAAGGKIEQTHCREAWSEFIEEISPTLTTLFPISKSGKEDWDVAAFQKSISKFKQQHAKIANARGVKFSDRSKMNRAAEKIMDRASTVNDLMRRFQEAQSVRAETSSVQAPLVQAQELLNSAPLRRDDEELCRLALRAHLANDLAPQEDHLALTSQQIIERPDLLSVLGTLDAGTLDGSLSRRAVRVDAITDGLRAAAILLAPPFSSFETTTEAKPMAQLRAALFRKDRLDLLGRLSVSLSPEEQSRVHRARGDAIEQVHKLIGELQQEWHALDELAVPLAKDILAISNEASQLANDSSMAPPQPALLGAWLEQVLNEARRATRTTVDFYRIKAPEPRRDEVLLALEQRRFSEALLLLHVTSERSADSVRETAWRRQARERFRDPMQQLLSTTGKGGADLVDAWKLGVKGHSFIQSTDRKLRTAFAQFVFPNELNELYDRGSNNPSDYQMPCAELRKWLAKSQLNPSFIPQLARIRNVVILTPMVPPTDAAFVQQAATIASKHEGSLAVLLAPRLTSETREVTLREFRKRKTSAALIDDLDLCRLLNPGGRQPNPVIGLLEIALEQQQWTSLSPFSAQDGQHVQMEMYVGRRQEAKRLSETPTYSRLFSGRKLGKSALLKFIQETADYRLLPSGCTLRVLYVPIVGADSESDVVDRILTEMRQRLNFTAPEQGSADPSDHLYRVMNRFIETRKSESLLIVLDEADRFVEGQLAAYDERDRREKCLSFRIRTDIEKEKDSMQLPRIRFVFAGYRATHTIEGAWANWGDVLRLEPLTPEEATQLVAGPLARFGIDASQSAPAIAYRCGYQPAVLLRFGEKLLQHMEQTRADTHRDWVVVQPDDVAVTFNHSDIHEEIRTVVRNNFQGNPRGRVVFFTLILEFAELAPAAGLDDAPRRLLERLRRIHPDTSWLQRDESSALGELTRQLRDFHDRQLVVGRPEASGQVYYLKFPHHLPLLRQPDQEAVLRQEIEALLQGDRSTPHAEVRALLPTRVLKEMRDALYHHDPSLPVRAVVTASHWPEAVDARSGGVADCLGIGPSLVRDANSSDASGEVRAWQHVSPVEAQRLIAQSAQGGPPPLLLGGTDLLHWALEQERSNPHEMFCIYGIGRLSRQALGWWFERIRALEFSMPNAVGLLYAATGGIPLLVRKLAELLDPSGEGGVNITEEQLQRVCSGFKKEVRAQALLLENGEPSIRLHPRELELLKMVVIVSREPSSDTVLEDLTMGWELLHRERYKWPGLSQADRMHLATLQHLGLLPTNPSAAMELPVEKLVTVASDDPLFAMVEALGLAP